MLDVTERKEAEELQRFLARMSRVLESTMEVEATVLNFADLSVPVLADICAVDIMQPDGKLERLAAVHRKPELQDKLNRGGVIDPADSQATAVLGVARTRASLFEPELRGSANAERGVTLGFESGTGLRSHLVLPIEARDRLLGVVSLGMTDTRRSFAPLNLLIAKDVVQRLAVAADKALLYETTRRAVLARDEILSLVSHDLRVPLNTIMAVTNLLSDHKQDRRSDVDYWLETLNRASEQIRVQIDDLLDVSRIEANRFAVESVPEMPKALLSEACDLLRPIAARKEIELICDLEGDFPPVHADAPQIVRVLNNLISNAIKFCSPGGRIRLSASVRYDEVWISVEDTGSGIPADEIERVFDRFWKGHPGDRRGAGLGLTIAKGVVEAHNGRIWVESKPGVGSTFTFSLPIVPRFAAEGSGVRG
jgi:signal transduction histidine kinase